MENLDINHDAMSNASHSSTDTTSSSQYWRELCVSLQLFSQFDGATRPQDIISRLNDLISNGDRLTKQMQVYELLMGQKDNDLQEKDERIAKLQKRNTSLAEMLQGQATLPPPKAGGEADGLRRSGSGCSSSSANSYSNEQKEGFEDLQKKYSQLVESKNTLYGHWKTVKTERDTLETQLQSAQNDCERLKNRVRILENLASSGATNRCIGDNEVVLKRDENGRCGVRFGAPKETPLLLESNTVLLDIKDDIPNRHHLNIGDYVIDVNGYNVQFMKLRDVLELVNSPGDLKLKLRPSRHNIIRTEKYLQGHKTQGEWGLTFGVYVKQTRPGSFSDMNGMQEMDELIKVNSHDVYELSLKKIYNAMNKDVRFRFQKLQNPYEQVYEHLTSPNMRSNRSSAAYSSGTFDDGRASPRSPRGRTAGRGPMKRSGSPARSSSTISDGSDIARQNLPTTTTAIIGNDVHCSVTNDVTSPFSSDGSGEVSGESSGGPSAEEVRLPESDIVNCVINKQTYEAFGWSLIGGNKVGIYVKSVENWSPVEKADIAVGWKILQINETSLENVAFSFVLDFLATLRNATSMKVKVKKIQPDVYRKEISQKPFDSFYVRSVLDYKKKSSDETSFKTGEVFNIIDSYYISESNMLRWVAKNSASQNVVIPCQKASIILSSENDGTYAKKGAFPRYYAVLDRVDIDAEGINQDDDDETEGVF